MLCHTILSDITDAYEWSFVAVPAQRNAGVTKQYGGSADHDRITVLQKQLQSQQAQLSAAEEDIRNALLSQWAAITEKPITGSRTDDISRTAGFAAAAAKRSAFHGKFAVTASRRKSKNCCQLTAVSNEITGVGTNEIGTGSMLFSDVDTVGRYTAL